MSHTVDCESWGQTTVYPASDETVVRGDRAYRTTSEQYRGYYENAPVGSDLPDHIPKWVYYCSDCAAEIGIAPQGED